jgi:hypothetical protein
MLIGVVLLLLLLLIGVVGLTANVWLVARVWKQRKELGGAPKIFAVLSVAAIAFGVLGTFIGFVSAMGAMGAIRGESIDPSQKASIMARSISGTMNLLAFPVLLWIPSLIALYLLMRAHRGP